MAKVRVIPSTINPITQNPINTFTKRRVAAYARVSTDSDEQYTSYEAQVNNYTKLIKEKPDWEFISVYADEGITGTNTKKRDGFNKMIADALDGKIDLIITKSISRFARNTLDTISITRELKKKGIEVYFEKENLWTLDPKSELILTIMASIAQEESHSISMNVTVGKRWKFQEGKVSFAYKSFLGYKKGEDGKIAIDETQAPTVRRIYKMFLIDGKTCSGIAEVLNKEGVLTPMGKNHWTKTVINSILTNEKYKGDALLQKSYTVDYLEHKLKRNEGEIPQYYVENSHPAIIDKGEWQMVQTELSRRARLGAKYSANSIFSSKLICEDCGGFYGQKVWHSNDKYSKRIYQCNGKFKGNQKCKTPHLSEDTIKDKFLKAFNEAMIDKKRIINDTQEIIELLTDTSEIDLKIDSLTNEIEVISELVKKLVLESSSSYSSVDEYERKYNELSNRFAKMKEELDKAKTERNYKIGRGLSLGEFLKTLKNSKNVLIEWDSEVWMIMVESGVVHKNKSITFKFYNGMEVTAE